MGLEDAAIPLRGCAYRCERQGSPAAILPDHRKHENRRNPVPRGRTFLSSSPARFLASPMLTAITHAAMYRSEEHTSELQSLMRISYAVFCLKKKKKNTNNRRKTH